MPNNEIPSEFLEVKNKPAPGTLFDRIDLVLTDTDNTTYYFTNNTEDFTVSGRLYTAIPFTISERVFSGGGALPRRQLTISNAALAEVLGSLVRDIGGLRGSTVTIHKVLAEQPNIDMSPDAEIYTVTHSEPGDQWLAVHLGGPRLSSQTIPVDTHQNSRCRVYDDYKGVVCGAVSVLLTCSGSYADCRERNNEPRFQAEITLGPNTVKIV